MKLHLLVFSVFGSAALSLFSQSMSFSINGNIEDIADGNVVMLLAKNGRTYSSIATDTVKDGHFAFTTDIDKAPENIAMLLLNNFNYVYKANLIYLTDGCKINVVGSGDTPFDWVIESSVPEQATENALNQGLGDIKMRLRQYIPEERRIKQMLRDAVLPPETKKELEDSLAHITAQIRRNHLEIDSVQIAQMAILPVDDAWMNAFSDISRAAAYQDGYPYMGELKDLYTRIPPEHLSTTAGELATLALFPPRLLQPGEPIPETRLVTIDGTDIKLSDFRGKYVLMDFWMSACGGCHHAMPELDRIATEMADKLEVLRVSIDTPEMWKVGLELLNGKSGHYRDPQGEAGLYSRLGCQGTPSYILISPEGTFLDKIGVGEIGSPRELVTRNIPR